MVRAPLRLEPGSPSWPDELSRIEGAPSALWLRGRSELLAPDRTRVALVGSRSPSPYGEDQSRRFASALARAGIVIVSGLARGIDAAAHRGALAVGGDTIAVLGSGVDRPWPGGELAETLAERGLLLSELPPGTPPRRHHFPLRNRILSGVSRAVVVIEAAHASGSLITARWAADQGRDVLAVPGRVDHPMARGCHRLLREGAALAECPADVLEELGLVDPGVAAPEGTTRTTASPLLSALTGETLDAEELARRLERGVRDVLVELVQLELTGAVARAPGGLWRRTR